MADGRRIGGCDPARVVRGVGIHRRQRAHVGDLLHRYGADSGYLGNLPLVFQSEGRASEFGTDLGSSFTTWRR